MGSKTWTEKIKHAEGFCDFCGAVVYSNNTGIIPENKLTKVEVDLTIKTPEKIIHHVKEGEICKGCFFILSDITRPWEATGLISGAYRVGKKYLDEEG